MPFLRKFQRWHFLEKSFQTETFLIGQFFRCSRAIMKVRTPCVLYSSGTTEVTQRGSRWIYSFHAPMDRARWSKWRYHWLSYVVSVKLVLSVLERNRLLLKFMDSFLAHPSFLTRSCLPSRMFCRTVLLGKSLNYSTLMHCAVFKLKT